jgi:hypothetical protein
VTKPDPSATTAAKSTRNAGISVLRPKRGLASFSTDPISLLLILFYPFPDDTSWAHSIATLSPRSSPQNAAVTALFTHYTAHIASWHDLNDPLSHFVTSIPYRAFTSPILFTAILALAASQLSHTTTYPSIHPRKARESVFCVQEKT